MLTKSIFEEFLSHLHAHAQIPKPLFVKWQISSICILNTFSSIHKLSSHRQKDRKTDRDREQKLNECKYQSFKKITAWGRRIACLNLRTTSLLWQKGKRLLFSLKIYGQKINWSDLIKISGHYLKSGKYHKILWMCITSNGKGTENTTFTVRQEKIGTMKRKDIFGSWNEIRKEDESIFWMGKLKTEEVLRRVNETQK